MINPMSVLKLKPLVESFRNNHPKFGPFLSAAAGAMKEDSILEMKVTTPEGQTIVSNLKINADDLALFAELKNILSSDK